MTTVRVMWDERPVGRLTIDRGIRPTSEFTYTGSWVAEGFAIDPDLPLSTAPFVRAGSLFGAFSDSAPDTWGRGLLARSHARTALGEADYLLLVDDFTRQGALRYLSEDGRWWSGESPIPVLTDLDQLRHAASDAEEQRGEPARMLVAAGAGTGGARPKAVVADGGHLWIAKFGSRHDTSDTEVAEHVVSRLAVRAGITASETRLFTGSTEPILLSRRFDREGAVRLGHLSAQTLLQSKVDPDRDAFDYLELADVLPELSSRPTRDLHELWRRVAFGCLVRNSDDHMRNHAFVRDGTGWRLSPAYDINTDLELGLTSASSVDGEAGAGKLESLVAACDYFRLDEDEALRILDEVAGAVRTVDGVIVDHADRVDSPTMTMLRDVLGQSLRSLL